MERSESSSEREVSTADLEARIRGTEFFRSLVENGSDAIVTIDKESTIIYANRSVERVFGYDPEELIGKKLTAIMPDRFHGDHFASVRRYLETGERELDWNDIYLPAEHRDGHEVPLSITFEEHVYGGDQVFSGIMRDITEQRERQRRLERQNERLEEFAGVVSHDLRNPLQTARAAVALARAGDEEALADLEAALDRMDDLIDGVLSLAKQGRAVGETEPVDLEALAAEAWTTAGSESGTLTVRGTLPTVTADSERLRTLLENLFRNSVEHAGEGVTVRIGSLDGEGFYVADDGPGIDDGDPDRLFGYGYTTAEDGTGYGLSIVRDVAEAHGWTVAAADSEHGGARFEVDAR